MHKGWILMTPTEALDKLLPSYERYYNIKRDDTVVPFAAEADFHSHTENYILVKAAKMADIDSNEYIYFSTQKEVDAFLLNELSALAWNKGLEKVKPYNGHKNSDISLIVLAENFAGDLKTAARKIKKSKNYNFGLYGWSNFKLCALDLSSGKSVSNFQGRDIKKLLFQTGLASCK